MRVGFCGIFVVFVPGATSSAAHRITLTPTQFTARLRKGGAAPLRLSRVRSAPLVNRLALLCPIGPLVPTDSFNLHLAPIPKLSSRTGETRKPPMLHFSRRGLPVSTASRAWGISQREFLRASGSRRREKGAGRTMSPAMRHPDSPCLRASVASASHSALVTRHPALSGAEGCFSNRHSCRLETRLNPCAPMKPLLLIVTQSPLFCAQIPTTNRAPVALAPRLCGRSPTSNFQHRTSSF